MDFFFITYIVLLLIICFLVMVAQRLKISYPIVLVLGGLLLSLVPSVGVIEIKPELIFLIILPPILYEAAWQTSWKDFWKWRRIIFSYAFFIVILTASVVAFVTSSLIPGFTLALGFLLGGIVSPPDAVSATSIMRDLDVPKRISAVIEGESLLNDASSIVVFRYALAAVVTGTFSFQAAATNFLLVIVMGALIGLAVALVFYAIHRWMPTTPNVDFVLTFVSPYIMYIAAEHFQFSGVLAVVTGGLFLAQQRQTILSPMSRIRGISVWSIIGFVLNGLVFMLIGLQLPTIVHQLGNISLWAAIKYSLIVAAVLIGSRLLIALGTPIFTQFVSRFIKTADASPGYRAPLVLGWAGMRGVVSLAAALSIPVYMANGEPFPQRNLILFITFSVILVTLVLQGLTLPLVIRMADLKDPDYKLPENEQDLRLQRGLARCALQKIERRYNDQLAQNALMQAYYDRLRNSLHLLENSDVMIAESESDNNNSERAAFEVMRKDIIETQRELLQRTNKRAAVSDDVIKKYLLALDLEEEQLNGQVKLY
ncbi:Na+/H+ antiporter [Chitinophagaceae bacterium LB-8]|uniref:Na+/H+ antiporter n=1 Tax=Paraflavisolibacter caeni TaxID=2982496 RepID=A0A9X2XWR5_9BACT|nr:Na+/H+ antiporter [Paraflavisolibacter caeni]MCU7549947.1 Na+/H+ antiporter [Paraflavisolibacter caeni]